MVEIILGAAFVLCIAVYSLWFGAKQIYKGIKGNQFYPIIKGAIILIVVIILVVACYYLLKSILMTYKYSF